MAEQTTMQTQYESPIEWSDLHTFIRDEDSYKNTYILDIYKNYYMFGGDRSVELSKDDELWRSNIKSPITNMFQSRLHNQILNADRRFVSYNTNPDIDNETAKEIAENMVEWMDYCRSKDLTMESFEDAIFDAGLIGWGIIKVGYRYVEYDRDYRTKDGKNKKQKVIEDYPVLYYTSPFNFYVDPGAKNIETARYVAERKLLNDQQINAQYSIYGLKISQEKSKELNGLSGQWTQTKDYESFKKNMPYYGTSVARDIIEDTRYSIKNETREVVEVHTKDSVTIYINGENFGSFKQLGPNVEYKYHVINFKRNPGTLFSLGTGYIVMPLQKVYDKITNLRIDNVTLTVNKIFLMENSMNIMRNSTRMKLKPGDIHRVSDIKGVQELPMSEIKESAYRETDVMFQLCQGATGVSNYGLGLQSKVERVAGATDMLQESLDSQTKPLINSIRKVMGKIMKEFMILTVAYTDQKELDKVLGPDNKLKDLNLDSLVNDYVFDFQLESQRRGNNAAERQQLLDILKLAPTLVDPAGRPIVDIKDIVEKLWRSMDLDTDTILTSEEFEDIIMSSETFNAMLQQRVQQEIAAQQQGTTTFDEKGQGGQQGQEKTGQQALRALQRQGVNIGAENTTNAAGING